MHWSQAIFIKSRTLEILDALGLHDRFHDTGQIVRRVRIHLHERNTASFEFAGLDTPYPYILSIPEEETIRILTDKLSSLAGTVERGVELVSLEQSEELVRARLNSPSRGEYQLDASVVVGTDGFQSAVRQAIADPFEGADYPDLWGVFDTGLVNWNHERDTLCPQLASPIAIPFALGKERWRVYFRTESSDGDVLSRVRDRLRLASPEVDLFDSGEPQFFHSHSRLARKFRIGRVYLAGDAAHVSNPLDGHGMNLGIQDGYNLGWKLAAIASGRATEELIDSYQAERQPVDQAIVQAGDESYARLMPTGAKALQDLFAFLATADGQGVAALAESEVGLGYDQSPIVAEIGVPPTPSPRTTKVGYRVANVVGLTWAGRRCTLQELIGLDPTVFVLLGRNPAAELIAALPALRAAADAGRGGLSFYPVVQGDASPSTLSGEVLLDPEGQLHERLGADQPRLCVIRPDGHLGFSCAPPSADALKAHLARMFRPI